MEERHKERTYLGFAYAFASLCALWRLMSRV